MECDGDHRRRFQPGHPAAHDDLPDIAFTETSPDGSTADVCVLQNEGGGQFQLVDTFAVDLQPDAIQAIDLGSGIVDLAVSDYLTGHVATFVGDGKGGFTPGPILDGGSYPARAHGLRATSAMATST